MSETQFDIQRALNDVALIRRVLDQSEQDNADSKLVGETLDANLVLQAIAFIAATALCILEALSGSSMTATLIGTRHAADLQIFGIGLMGFILTGLLIALYFVLWRAARNNGEELQAYISRNFRYVKNLSFISDLFVKFATLSLLLLAGKAEWMAPVLLVFTGDYLLQGRFFTLPTKIAALLGIFCIAGGVAQFMLAATSLVFPLAGFAVIAGLSTARLAFRHKQQAGVVA